MEITEDKTVITQSIPMIQHTTEVKNQIFNS